MASETSVTALSRPSGERAAPIAATIAAIALATLGGAWVFEFALGIKPCPLCLEQRYAYYLVIPLAFVIALLAGKGVPRAVVIGGFVVVALAMLANAGLGAYHAGVEWQFWPGPTTCAGSTADLGRAGDLLSRLDSVKVVRCDEVQWRFLGLSLAGYNALISLALAGLAIIGASAAAKRI